MKKFVLSFLACLLILPCVAILVGCGSQTKNLAKTLDDSVTNLVYSVSSLDWPDESVVNDFNISLAQIQNQNLMQNCSANLLSYSKSAQLKNIPTIRQKRNVQNKNIENQNITKQAEAINQIESETENNIVSVPYPTDQIIESTTIMRSKVGELIEKRADIILFVNALYNGKVKLAKDVVTAINAYINIIKDNTSYLNNNRGLVTNQLSRASDLKAENVTSPLINAYIIRTAEAMDTRIVKLDSCLLAIDSIIDILNSNINGLYAIKNYNYGTTNPLTNYPIIKVPEQNTEAEKIEEKIITENKNANSTSKSDENNCKTNNIEDNLQNNALDISQNIVQKLPKSEDISSDDQNTLTPNTKLNDKDKISDESCEEKCEETKVFSRNFIDKNYAKNRRAKKTSTSQINIENEVF